MAASVQRFFGNCKFETKTCFEGSLLAFNSNKKPVLLSSLTNKKPRKIGAFTVSRGRGIRT